MRVVASFAAALLVTLALFYALHYLIAGSGQRIAKTAVPGGLAFVRLKREPDSPTDAHNRRSLPPKPMPRKSPPPAPRLQAAQPKAPELPELNAAMPKVRHLAPSGQPFLGSYVAPKPKSATQATGAAPAPGPPAQTHAKAEMGVGAGHMPSLPGTAGAGEGDALALLKVAPQYPRKAALAGKEGWVKVEFTITGSGTVVDPVVLDSKPRRVFDRAALKAIRKWRFKPRVVNGEPVERRAEQTIEFKLSQR